MLIRLLILLFLCTSVYADNPPERIFDEGVYKGVAYSLDCVGSGIVCSNSGTTGTITVAGSSGTVSSVATNATLTGGPITTTGTLGLNLSNANTWAATQTFPTAILGSSTGVSATAATGVLTLAGIGNTNNENITFDFEQSANQLFIGSTSGVTTFQFVSPNIALSSNGGNFRMNSNDSQAADIGGSLAFGGNRSGTSNVGTFAVIAGRKENGTAGNAAGYLQLGTRGAAGNVTEALRITSAQVVKFSQLTTNGFLKTGSSDGTTSVSTAVNLASEVTGDLPFANLAQLSANSVAGNQTTGTADMAAVTLAANTVLGRGTGGNVDDLSVGFGLKTDVSSISFNLDETKVDTTGDWSWRDGKVRWWNPAVTFAYTLKGSAIAADRDITLPLLTTNDTFVFAAFAQTLTNKTLTSPVINTSVSGTAFLDEDDMTSDSNTKLASQQSIKAYVDNRANFKAPISGRYYPPMDTAQFPGTAAVAADWTYCAPFKRDFPFTLDKLSINVTTAVAASNARLGLYNDSNGQPSTKIVTAGTVSGATTGVKEITGIAQAMPAGIFWACFQTDSALGVASFGAAIGHEYNAQIGVGAFGDVLELTLDFTSTYAGGLPATFTTTQVNGVDTPQMYWRP